MQKVNREQLVEKAAQLLSNGVVSSVLGWSKGEFDYIYTISSNSFPMPPCLSFKMAIIFLRNASVFIVGSST